MSEREDRNIGRMGRGKVARGRLRREKQGGREPKKTGVGGA
jgi:hypothetical protein